METIPIPRAPPGGQDFSSSSSLSDSTHSRPPGYSTTATAKLDQQEYTSRIVGTTLQLGDFSSLKSQASVSKHPHAASSRAESQPTDISSVQPIYTPRDIADISAHPDKLPYNLLKVPKLGNFTSLELLSPDGPISHTSTPSNNKIHPTCHCTSAREALLGDFAEIFEHFRHLSLYPSTTLTTDEMKYICPGARAAADGRDTCHPVDCSEPHGNSELDQQPIQVPQNCLTPVRCAWQCENWRSASQPALTAASDSDWRSARSSPSPSTYDTDLTSPPPSPTRGRQHMRTISGGSHKSNRTSQRRLGTSPLPKIERTDPFSPYVEAHVAAERERDTEVKALYPKVAAGGVHVFADVSNIYISLINTIKMAQHMDPNQKFIFPEMDWECILRIVARGRSISSKQAGASIKPDSVGKPRFVRHLEDVGFEVETRYRVENTEGRFVESLVDETIQARIGECLEDHKDQKGTIVIITGDGRPAQHSSGFKAYAEYALKLGWNVELVCWKLGCSQNWKDASWHKYGARYRLIELDDYIGEICKDHASCSEFIHQ